MNVESGPRYSRGEEPEEPAESYDYGGQTYELNEDGRYVDDRGVDLEDAGYDYDDDTHPQYRD